MESRAGPHTSNPHRLQPNTHTDAHTVHLLSLLPVFLLFVSTALNPNLQMTLCLSTSQSQLFPLRKLKCPVQTNLHRTCSNTPAPRPEQNSVSDPVSTPRLAGLILSEPQISQADSSDTYVGPPAAVSIVLCKSASFVSATDLSFDLLRVIYLHGIVFSSLFPPSGNLE